MNLQVFIVRFQLFGMLAMGAGDPELHTFREHTPGGILTESYTYYLENGSEVKHGVSKLYFDDGRHQSKTEFVHGEKNGTETAYYKRIEKKVTENKYVNGVQSGMSRWWSPEGKLLFECEYRNGKTMARTVNNEL